MQYSGYRPTTYYLLHGRCLFTHIIIYIHIVDTTAATLENNATAPLLTMKYVPQVGQNYSIGRCLEDQTSCLGT